MESTTLLKLIMDQCVDSDSEDENEIRNIHKNNETVIEKIFFKIPRTCMKNFVLHVVPNYNDKEFITHFRVGRNLFNLLVDLFNKDESYIRLNKNGRILSASFHLLVFLWFCGHETASFRDVADR